MMQEKTARHDVEPIRQIVRRDIQFLKADRSPGRPAAPRRVSARRRADIEAGDLQFASARSRPVPKSESNVAAAARHIQHTQRTPPAATMRANLPPQLPAHMAQGVKPAEPGERPLVGALVQCRVVHQLRPQTSAIESQNGHVQQCSPPAGRHEKENIPAAVSRAAELLELIRRTLHRRQGRNDGQAASCT
jgi:hypothetical protein